MKITPLFDRVVIEELPEDTTDSGIFLGKSHNDSIKTGKVLYVGAGNENDEGKKSTMYVKPNDVVLFSKFSSAEATLSGKTVLILRQTDILAILN